MIFGRTGRVSLIALTVSALVVCGNTRSTYGQGLPTPAAEDSRPASSSPPNLLWTILDNPEESLATETTKCTSRLPKDPSEEKEMSTENSGCQEDNPYSDILAAAQPTDEWGVNPYYVAGGLAILGGGAAALLFAGGSSDDGTDSDSTASSSDWLDGYAGDFDAALAENLRLDSEFLGMNQSSERALLGAMSPNERINAHIAYGYGLSGAGTRIAIMDGGKILETHEEFAREEFAEKDIQTLYEDGAILDDHATHVAGLAVGDRNNTEMMGIAYDADLLVTTFWLFGPGTIDWITDNKADVWNNSWIILREGVDETQDTISHVIAHRDTNGVTSGRTLADLYGATEDYWNDVATAIDRYQANGGVVVWANSNNTTIADANVISALPELYPELNEAWITVVNAVEGTSGGVLTEEGGFTLLSAPCGSTAAYCLSMDGYSVRSSIASGSGAYEDWTGTSMAAPMVSGAVALLKDAFPNHTADQLTIRLLASADNTFFTDDPANSDKEDVKDFGNGIMHTYSEIWGHGFVDLEAALQPLGTVITTGASGMAHVLSDGSSEILMSPAFGTSLETSLSAKRFIMQDGLDGRFVTQLGNFVRTVEPDDLQSLTTDWHRQVHQDLVELPLPVLSGFVLEFDRRHHVNSLVTQQNGSFLALQTTFSNGSTLRASYGRSINDALGFQPQQQDTTTLLTQSQTFAIPFTGFAPTSLWGTWHSGHGDETWTIGWFGNQDAVGVNEYVGTNDSFGNPNTADRQDATRDYASTGIITEKTWSVGNLAAVQLTGGTLTEQGGLLGTRTSGAFANDVSTTAFARSAVNVDLAQNWSVMAHYTIGHSWAEADEDTLFTDFSNIMTDSFALSLTGQDIFLGRDEVQLTLFQPLRALSGNATVTLPTGQDSANHYALLYTSETIDLTPQGRELRLIGSYSQAPWEGAKIDITATLTHQRLHDPTARFSADLFSGVTIAF